MGTPQELTNEQGEMVWLNYEFAWGGRYTHFYKKQSLNDYAILEHELQPIRFQGQFFDQETSLHYNRFRYYDSDVGMFIQRDPIGLLGGSNVFAYAPNPIHWVDVFGLNPLRFLIKIIKRPAKSKPISLPSQKTVKVDMQHILDRHTCTGCVARQSGIKDLFPKDWDAKQIEKAVREAYSNIKIIKTQGDRVLGQGKYGNRNVD
ncbi:MAG: RHS repeat-associated core domain-containing protein [Lonepinella koalarum]|nr:RHS repeat-associated core domain-containing protein [Lonepinella koalarum]